MQIGFQLPAVQKSVLCVELIEIKWSLVVLFTGLQLAYLLPQLF